MGNKIFKVPPEAFPEGTEGLFNWSLKELPVLSSARAGVYSGSHKLLFPEVSRLASSLCALHGLVFWVTVRCILGSVPSFQRTLLHGEKMGSRPLGTEVASQAMGGTK